MNKHFQQKKSLLKRLKFCEYFNGLIEAVSAHMLA